MNWYSGETQISWACKQLLAGREISHVSEIAEARGWRLSAIIFNLKHEYNWPILARYNKRRVAFYSLDKNADDSKLRLPRSFAIIRKGDATTPPSN